MLKRFAAVAICLILIWAISLERSYAWLGLQSAASERWLNVGLHPLSFDFTANVPGDVRWQLIGQEGIQATVKAQAQGLEVQPLQSSFELRLNLAGARLTPEQVTALILDVRPLLKNAALPQFSLAVHSDLNDPGWIADLGRFESPDQASMYRQIINLSALEFKREPARILSIPWAKLPSLSYLRLYGNSPTKRPFILATVAFKLAQNLPKVALQGMRAEPLLNAFERARAGHGELAGQVLTSRYRGQWIAPILQMWISVGCLMCFCVLISFEFASPQPVHRARARAWLVPAIFLPVITMLWGAIQWPVDYNAAFAPQWFVLMLGLMMAIGYRWINKPPQFKPFNFVAADRAAWLSCMLPTAAAALVLVIGFGALPGAEEAEPRHFGLLLAAKYLAFAGFQQWLLQTLIWTNLRRAALLRGTAVLFSALLFALLHTPNFMLMLLCFCGALFWCRHYARYRRLLPLILSHAFLGFLCVSVIPNTVLRSADIGTAYFLK